MVTGGPPRAAVRRLPRAFAELAREQPGQMAAGAHGKVGVLRLRFERRGARTRLVDLYATGPQKVQRVHYLDEALPDMAVAIIQSVGGGILQGDRLAVEIDLGPGARALVTTQSATKVYRMEHNYATQRIAAHVRGEGYLELLTDYVIPYEGARLYTEVDLTVDRDAAMVYSDGVTAGRVASGEAFAFRLLHTRLEARACDGGLRLADTTVLAPGDVDPRRTGLLREWTDLGSLAVLCPPDRAAGLTADLQDTLAAAGTLMAGASLLPGGDGAFVRVLGPSALAAQTALHHAWTCTRSALLGTGVPPLHSLKYGSEPRAPRVRERGGVR